MSDSLASERGNRVESWLIFASARLAHSTAAKVSGCFRQEGRPTAAPFSHRPMRKGYSGSRSPFVAVVEFLGYNPFEMGGTVAQGLVNHRKALGITQKNFANEIAVDQCTLARWEREEREPKGKYILRVKRIIEKSQLATIEPIAKKSLLVKN